MTVKRNQWSDEYWLLLMRLYLRKPVGVKPLYSRSLVDLALELHVQPQVLYEQMFRLRSLDEPKLRRLWETYAGNPNKLARGIQLLRRMKGFGMAGSFYDGVEVSESWEKDFRPLPERNDIKPVMLILILDLYFKLVPATMVVSTPEIQQLARLMRIKTQTVVDVMDIFQVCDPYLNRTEVILDPLLNPCQQIWQRFGNDKPEQLAALAAQMTDYFKS